MYHNLAVALLLGLTLVAATNPRYVVENQKGTIPSQRGAATLSTVGNKVVLFGGFDECFNIGTCENVFYNDTFVFKTTNKKWTKSTSALVPAARSFHLAASYDDTDSVIIYGGTVYNAAFTQFEVFGDMWQYFPASDQWVQRIFLNAGPGQRVGSGLAIKGFEMFLFGGLDNFFGSHNDLWKFNLISNLWTQLYADAPDGTPGRPPVRYLPKFEITGSKIYLYGGNINPSILGAQRADLWEYLINSNTFVEIPVPTQVRSRVHGAAAATSKGFALTLGDVNDDVNECKANEISGGQNPVNETHVFKTTTGWNPFVDVQNSPKLKRVAYATVGNKLYVWGGFDFVCAPTKVYDPVTSIAIWNTNMYSLKLNKIGL